MPRTHSLPSQRHRSIGQRGIAHLADFVRGDVRFSLLAGWLTIVFLFGGSSRPDIAALQLTRPLSLLVLGFGLSCLTADEIRRNRMILALAAAWLGLLLLQLVPLPPEIWHGLGGREIVREIDQEAQLGDMWRPLSMAPFATWNAFWASITPASVLVLAIGLDRQDFAKLLPVLISLGFVSAFVALLQIIGDPDGPLYFYRYTHNGLPVGLLANRNHQALLLATVIPMLAVWAASDAAASARGRFLSNRWIAVFGGVVVLIPMILLTGSRSGALVGLIALLSLPLFLAGRTKSTTRNPRSHGRRTMLYLLGGGLVTIVALTVFLGRALSVNRLLQANAVDDLRIQLLPTLHSMIMTYLPLGSGTGTFFEVFRMHEPASLLGPGYRNQAHNDWLDLVLTGGIPALVVLTALFVFLGSNLKTAISSRYGRNVSHAARLGFLIILMFGIASVTDYPLRVPSLGCLGVIALLWVASNHSQSRNEDFASANI